MLETQTISPAAEALVEALDAMACVSALPAAPAAPAPLDRPVLVRIAFAGAPPGAMELMAPAALGALLAAGMLGTTPEDADARGLAADVLRELMNVACGVLLRAAGGPVEMALPELRAADVGEWQSFRTSPGACELDAEGLPLCVRLLGAGS
jgi:hypothetical protein